MLVTVPILQSLTTPILFLSPAGEPHSTPGRESSVWPVARFADSEGARREMGAVSEGSL